MVVTLGHHVVVFLISFVSSDWGKNIWKPSKRGISSVGAVIRFSLFLSFVSSISFVGCAVTSSDNDDHYYAKEKSAITVATTPTWTTLKIRETCAALGLAPASDSDPLLSHLSGLAFLRQPVGFFWLTSVALFSVLYVYKNSRLLDIQKEKKILNKIPLSESVGRMWKSTLGRARRDDDPKPQFRPMAEWYNLQVVEAGVGMFVSLNLFLERFDFRAFECSAPDIFPPGDNPEVDYDDRFADEDELWFDFMADTGDGGASTYSIARALAQPSLTTSKGLSLRRADLVIIGGDLAYPSPSVKEYDDRLFGPFCDAMEPPPSYDPQNIAMPPTRADDDDQERDSPKRKNNNISTTKRTAPCCYAIPGNHDWFDGLHAFARCILHRDWLGGWRLPQRRSYFCLKLPGNWWIFAFDTALNEDIDVFQYRYFADVANRRVGPDDRLVFVTRTFLHLFERLRDGTHTLRQTNRRGSISRSSTKRKRRRT